MSIIGKGEHKSSTIEYYFRSENTDQTHTLPWTPPSPQSVLVFVGNELKQYDPNNPTANYSYSVSGNVVTLGVAPPSKRVYIVGIQDVGILEALRPQLNSIIPEMMSHVEYPIFAATLSANQSSNGAIHWDEIVVNTAGSQYYDQSKGEYYAPVTGEYQVDVGVTLLGSTFGSPVGDYDFKIQRSGHIVTKIAGTSPYTEHTLVFSGIVHLDQNQGLKPFVISDNHVKGKEITSGTRFSVSRLK